jgi:hypothetical protein
MPEERFRQTADMIFDDLNGQFTVYHPHQGRFFALNATGVRLWNALHDWVELDVLRDILTQDCHAPLDAATVDVQAFVLSLESRGLIERQSGAGS